MSSIRKTSMDNHPCELIRRWVGELDKEDSLRTAKHGRGPFLRLVVLFRKNLRILDIIQLLVPI